MWLRFVEEYMQTELKDDKYTWKLSNEMHVGGCKLCQGSFSVATSVWKNLFALFSLFVEKVSEKNSNDFLAP